MAAPDDEIVLRIREDNLRILRHARTDDEVELWTEGLQPGAWRVTNPSRGKLEIARVPMRDPAPSLEESETYDPAKSAIIN